MSIKRPSKCPNCGSISLADMKPPTGTSYILTTVDQAQDPPVFNASGLPVNVIGCSSCGVATLHIDSHT